MSYKFIGTTCFGLYLTIIRSLRAKIWNMQLSYHSTQRAPIRFNIVQYNDPKNYRIMWTILKYVMVAFIPS